MKIALIGADGQLGTDIYKIFKEKGLDVTGLTIDDINICNKDLSKEVLFRIKPALVINTAAYNLVDDCEENISTAFLVNVEGVKNVAQICLELNSALMHFSTDYVFGGYEKKIPYTENDCPAPLSIYGISKLAGEYVIKYLLTKYYIIRVSGLYGHKSSLGKGYNFVDLMLNLAIKETDIKVVDDQILTPTSTKDVAKKLYELILTGKYGTYHMTNNGSCSWFEFAVEIFKLAGLDIKVIPIKTCQLNSKARRPNYSVLDNKRLREIGLSDLRHWKVALNEYIEEKKKFIDSNIGKK